MTTEREHMETQTVETTDTLAIFRQQVQEEKESSTRKFSDAAAVKFAAIKARDKIDSVEAERFRNALRSTVVTPENLERLIQRCNTSKPVDIDRRAARLQWWIVAGYALGKEIDTVGAINFFSEPTETDGLLTLALAKRIKAAKMSQEVGIVERPCKSGKKCMRYEKRSPAPAKGSGDYCSTACAASDRAREKRQSTALPSKTVLN
jgi:hypothetical protein